MIDKIIIMIYNKRKNHKNDFLKGEKVMKKKTLTAKEILCGIPRLRDYFSEMDRKINTFQPQEGTSEGVEQLKRKRSELLTTITKMDRIDLRILYYIHKLNKIYPCDIARALEKLFYAQEELKDALKGGDKEMTLPLR